MLRDESPTARALLALELIQDSPGVTAQRLSERLGVTDRAVRRYVGILREAGVPVESVRGPYGGYRIGRGLRVPPLMFTSGEALALVMAVLEQRRESGGDDDPVESALRKILRVLPESVGAPAAAVRELSTRGPADPNAVAPDPETATRLAQACADRRRLRLGYRSRETVRPMDVEPWGVVVRRGRWFLLCWSVTADARRVLRVDRVVTVDVLPESFDPPADLDPVDALEEHLSEGWRYAVEVEIEAPVERVRHWVSRSLGRLEALDEHTCLLTGSTDEPAWFAARLAGLEGMSFRVRGGPEVRAAVADLGRRLVEGGA